MKKINLKKVFLNENIGSKEEQENLNKVQMAINSMKSVIDNKTIDPGNPAFKDIEAALNSMQLLVNPKEQSGVFEELEKSPHESEMQKAYSTHEKEQEQEKKKTFFTKIDEPFEKSSLKECPLNDMTHEMDSAEQVMPIHIEVEPSRAPMDTFEHVSLIFDDDVSDMGGTNNFKPAGSPGFDSRKEEVVQEDLEQNELFGDMENNDPEGSEPLVGIDDNELDDIEYDPDWHKDVLQQIEDEDFGRHDYPGSENKPRGY